MNNSHLSEEEIQGFVLGQGRSEDIKHLSSCPLCSSKAANYRSILSTINDLPKPAFDFDVASLVIAQLPVQKSKVTAGDTWVYLLVFAAIGSLIIPIYLYRDELLKMFNGVLPVALYLIVLAAILILVFQGLEIFRKYRKQMNSLNY
ncbi:hypothetical protein [Mucilaginibacter sp. SJ]|uniref:hypothetical protein n=1 Tax=Mucilaginibacter sp. SJ TaxID=3029053 RepID=UPI0023A9A341|nr:hypothetical protein [Mucilaginibacter sp. SJ]WEA00573.1 hypothetical protein MusilaSJ_24260 [Mucilaginibacter sp. SJ]